MTWQDGDGSLPAGHDEEVPVIHRQNSASMSFRASDDSCVGQAKWQVVIAGHELLDALRIAFVPVKRIRAISNVAEKARFNILPKPCFQKPRHLAENRHRNEKGAAILIEDTSAGGVIWILAVDES